MDAAQKSPEDEVPVGPCVIATAITRADGSGEVAVVVKNTQDLMLVQRILIEALRNTQHSIEEQSAAARKKPESRIVPARSLAGYPGNLKSIVRN